jgi:hypothetical protein
MTRPSHSEYRARTGRLRAGEHASGGLANSAIFQSVVIALLVYLSLSGQPAVAIEKTDDIDTNRPSFMFSPLVVPNGSLQLENGALYSHLRHGTNVVDVPEMQLRLGVFKNTEFQMFVPNIFIGHTEGSHLTSTRLSHIGEVGIKRQIPFKRLQLSLIGSINIPTGSTSLVGSGVQPVLHALGCADQDLGGDGYAINFSFKRWTRCTVSAECHDHKNDKTQSICIC